MPSVERDSIDRFISFCVLYTFIECFLSSRSKPVLNILRFFGYFFHLLIVLCVCDWNCHFLFHIILCFQSKGKSHIDINENLLHYQIISSGPNENLCARRAVTSRPLLFRARLARLVVTKWTKRKERAKEMENLWNFVFLSSIIEWKISREKRKRFLFSSQSILIFSRKAFLTPRWESMPWTSERTFDAIKWKWTDRMHPKLTYFNKSLSNKSYRIAFFYFFSIIFLAFARRNEFGFRFIVADLFIAFILTASPLRVFTFVTSSSSSSVVVVAATTVPRKFLHKLFSFAF